MGHKILQDHAHAFCQMFMGWRMHDDLRIFTSLPDGELFLNILDGTCEHSLVGMIDTYIAKEIKSWFLRRLDEHRIPVSHILAATLKVTMTKPSKYNRGILFDWKCCGVIKTTDRDYLSHLEESHGWN